MQSQHRVGPVLSGLERGEIVSSVRVVAITTERARPVAGASVLQLREAAAGRARATEKLDVGVDVELVIIEA